MTHPDHPSAEDLAGDDARYLLHPHTRIGSPEVPMIVDRGSGAHIWDIHGDRFIDGTCGLWQCQVGHGRAELAEVASEQMGRLEFYSSFGRYTNEPSIRLARRLVELAPANIRKVFLTSGGSETNETSIKLARLAHFHAGNPDRNIILARAEGYHGMGGSSLAVTGFEDLKEGFGSLDPQVEFVRSPRHGWGEQSYTDMMLEDLEARIRQIGPERIAAFIGEPVPGFAGVLPPPGDYWPRLKALLDSHGILLILDEVVTAFGRIGHWFAAEHYGIEPDLISTAKGISSGYAPIGAVLIGERVLAMAEGAHFLHGFTYTGHPVSCALALANIEIIEREGLLERAGRLGARLLAGLSTLTRFEIVSAVRGHGMMFAIEVPEETAREVELRAREQGLIVRAVATSVFLSPPLVLTDQDADRIVEILHSVFADLE